MKDFKIHKTPILTGLFIAGCVVASVAAFSFIPIDKDRADQEYLADFSGFGNETQIQAQVTSWGDETSVNQIKLDETGTGRIPAQGMKAAARSYDFNVKNPDHDFKVNFKQTKKDGSYIVTGRGLEPFARVMIETANGPLETKADWSGAFEEAGLVPRAEDEQNSFIKLAFYAGPLQGAIVSDEPRIGLLQTVQSTGSGSGMSQTELINQLNSSTLSPTGLSNLASTGALNTSTVTSLLNSGSLSTLGVNRLVSAGALNPATVAGMVSGGALNTTGLTNVLNVGAISPSTLNSVLSVGSGAISNATNLLNSGALTATGISTLVSASGISPTTLSGLAGTGALNPQGLSNLVNSNVLSPAALTSLIGNGTISPSTLTNMLQAGNLSAGAISGLMSTGAITGPAITGLLTSGSLSAAGLSGLLNAGVVSPAALSGLIGSGAIGPATVAGMLNGNLLNSSTLNGLLSAGALNVSTLTNLVNIGALSPAGLANLANLGGAGMSALQGVLNAGNLNPQALAGIATSLVQNQILQNVLNGGLSTAALTSLLNGGALTQQMINDLLSGGLLNNLLGNNLIQDLLNGGILDIADLTGMLSPSALGSLLGGSLGASIGSLAANFGPTSTLYGPAHQPQIVSNYINASQTMAQQASATGMQAIMSFGLLLDAKEQLEAQRDIQQLRAEATRDYHPGEQMCRVGSFVKSLASAESAMTQTRLAISDNLMSIYSNRSGSASANGPDDYSKTRLEQYKADYCVKTDTNEQLGLLCEESGTPGQDANRDIDFTRTFDSPLTVEFDGDDTKHILALAKNLYWQKAQTNINNYEEDNKSRDYMSSRRIAAMSNLAHNSFATIMAMKNRAPENTNDPGWSFMKTLMREFGMQDAAIEDFFGERPSYYAQMDILTKRMFQNPRFYTDLYDKPANVSRMNASLEAIRSMQARDHFQAALRREMLLSALLEEELVAKANQKRAELYDTEQTGGEP